MAIEARYAWSEPGVEDLGLGVYRIPLPLPDDALRAVNVYVIVYGNGVVLIDGGWALDAAEQALADGLRTIGYGLAEISEFLVTHVHRDHYTQAVAIRRKFGTPVSLGAGERPGLECILAHIREPWPGISHLDQLTRRGAAPLVARLQSTRVPTDPRGWQLPDRWLADGTQLSLGSRTLSVVATPGHTRGHVVYRDEQAGLMFAGDHVLPHITPSIALEAGQTRWPLRDYLDSLYLVRSLPDMRLLPAHGPVTDSVHARVDDLLAHHERRLMATLKVVEAGAGTAYEAALALTWTRNKRRLDELDLFNQMLAVFESAAHLDVLVLQGELVCETTAEGVETYRTTKSRN
jgi:glyoxylase-like metal-dependent hydrolase (beta-lactamase superfamily II)